MAKRKRPNQKERAYKKRQYVRMRRAAQRAAREAAREEARIARAKQVLTMWHKIAGSSPTKTRPVLAKLIKKKLKKDNSKETHAIAYDIMNLLNIKDDVESLKKKGKRKVRKGPAKKKQETSQPPVTTDTVKEKKRKETGMSPGLHETGLANHTCPSAASLPPVTPDSVKKKKRKKPRRKQKSPGLHKTGLANHTCPSTTSQPPITADSVKKKTRKNPSQLAITADSVKRKTRENPRRKAKSIGLYKIGLAYGIKHVSVKPATRQGKKRKINQNILPQQAFDLHTQPVVNIESLSILSNVPVQLQIPQAPEMFRGNFYPQASFFSVSSTVPVMRTTSNCWYSNDMVRQSLVHQSMPPARTSSSVESFCAMIQSIRKSQEESARNAAATPDLTIENDVDECQVDIDIDECQYANVTKEIQCGSHLYECQIGNHNNENQCDSDINERQVGNDTNKYHFYHGIGERQVGNDTNKYHFYHDINQRQVGNDNNGYHFYHDVNERQVGNDTNKYNFYHDINERQVGNDTNENQCNSDISEFQFLNNCTEYELHFAEI